MSYVPGLEGVVVGETSISHVEGDLGRLSYRGVVIEDIVHKDYSSCSALCRSRGSGGSGLGFNAGRPAVLDLYRIR